MHYDYGCGYGCATRYLSAASAIAFAVMSAYLFQDRDGDGDIDFVDVSAFFMKTNGTVDVANVSLGSICFGVLAVNGLVRDTRGTY